MTIAPTTHQSHAKPQQGRWRQAEEALARFATKDSLASGLLMDRERRGSEFAMTAFARSRLVAGIHGQPPSGREVRRAVLTVR